MGKPIINPDLMRDLDSYERRIIALERRISELSQGGLIPHEHAFPEHTHEFPDHTHEFPDHTHESTDTYSYYYLQSGDLYSSDPNDPSPLGGWSLDGFPNPHFVRQGNTVHLNAVFGWNGTSELTSSPIYIIRPGVIPVEFCPTGFKRFLGRTAGGGQDPRLWNMYMDGTTGMTYLDVMHEPGNIQGGFPYGELGTTALDYVTIDVNISYTIAPTGDSDQDGPEGVVLP